MIKLKRVYDPATKADGRRFLVERLWPRGMRKADVHMDAWLKDVAPSPELRRWFNHDSHKWSQFRRRYASELRVHSDALKPLVQAARKGTITLLYSAHDSEHNNAVALKDYIESKFAV